MPIGTALGSLAGGSLGSAALIGGATLGSALIGSSAASRAASVQARAAQQARADMQPFMVPGQGAMASLARLYGIDPTTGAYSPDNAFNQASLEAFQRSPDYQFALQSGIGALENSQAARGLLRSGSTLRGITDYGQQLATQQFGNYRGALGQLASIGAGAASGSGQLAMERGQAQASGIVGAGNAWAGALGSLGNYAMMQQGLQQQRDFLTGLMRPSSYSAPAPGAGSFTYGAPAPYSSFNPFGYSSLAPGGLGSAPY